MQKQFATAIVQAVIGVLFCLMVAFNSCQVNRLEKSVIEEKQMLGELNATISLLRETIESGNISVRTAGGAPAATPATPGSAVNAGIAGEEAHRRFYADSEWAEMVRPGNLIKPRTDLMNVPGSTPGGTLRRAFINDIPDMNPLTQNAADLSELQHYFQSMLATRQRTDPDRWVGDLAYRVEVNEDFTEYHVWLRKGVLWHPAAVDFTNPRYQWLKQDRYVVADDFKFYLDLVMNPVVEAAHLRNYYEKCAGIEVINDHEFIVRWTEKTYVSVAFTLEMTPIPRWLYGADEDGGAFSPEELGQRFNNHWYNLKAIGSGPFRFAEWVPGNGITLERFERYYDEKPPLEKIVFPIIADPTARLNNLRASQVEYTPLTQAQYIEEVQGGKTQGFQPGGDLVGQTYQGSTYRYLGWNADGRYFSDRRVRLAMTHAFDRELLLRENMHGLGRIVTGPLYIDGPDYDKSLQMWPFDLNRAAQLLDESGWKDNDGNGIREKLIDGELVEFEFGMVTYGYRQEFIAAMEHYKNDLRKIGVVMNVVPVEWAVMVQRMEEKDFDAYTGGWQLGWDTDLFQIWHSSQADAPKSSNRVGFRSVEGDRIIEALRQEFDPAERTRLLREFHKITHDEQPYTFWFAPLEQSGWTARLKNVNFSPLRPFDSSRNWFLAAP